MANAMEPAKNPVIALFSIMGIFIVDSFAPTNFIVSNSEYLEFRINLTVL